MVVTNSLRAMPRLRNNYVRGQKITSPAWNGIDTTPSVVAMARIFREALDNGTAEIGDLDIWIQSSPEDSRPALLQALHALGINP